MALKLYDTLTRTKREFVPLDPANVRMYVCGPTVYDFAHIGNARPVIVFDVLFRLLRHLYGPEHVIYVRNITDVDDKINARAAERGIPIRELTQQTYADFQADVAALGCLEPTVEPRATENIPQMIDLIGRLLDNGCAYIAHGPQGREILFSVEKMKDYGQLSHRNLNEQIEGARVAVEAHKRNPFDFVLWKESSAGEPGWLGEFRVDGKYPSNVELVEIYGRPGWHIECSAMSWRFLGETFDIHGGGIDLVFPHHENEIAQSRGAFHTDVMANYWMHNGFLQVEGEKMAKSAGNFVTIRELLADWPGEVLRLNMLRSHYRQPIDWTVRGLEETWDVLSSWTTFPEFTQGADESFAPAVMTALCDDLNTAQMMTELHALDKAGNFSLLGPTLRALGFLHPPKSKRDIDHQQVEMLINERIEARKSKNFAESDRIRDQLAAMGVVLRDSKDGTTWEIAR